MLISLNTVSQKVELKMNVSKTQMTTNLVLSKDVYVDEKTTTTEKTCSY